MIKTVKARRTYNGALRKEQAQLTRGRILDAARRLLLSGTYSSVTMEDIASEAGVAYQTVYAIFGTKLRLAQGLIEIGFPHVADALKLLDQLRPSDDPEVGLRTSARVSRLIYELCADLLRFMRESGDPGLLARYREGEELRLKGMIQHGVPATLERSGRLRAGISPSEAVAVIWALSGPDQYTQLVFERGWTPSRYEEWLGDSLINTLLQPAGQTRPKRA
ncbi:MAG TPA: TetR/AcrR family transcriptional regulator [Candidatus Dormibacteraeota bacterium]|nr:TetR/AcrR family transcriptional regulator [Candidatus Dormibacteraeota bacterium]